MNGTVLKHGKSLLPVLGKGSLILLLQDLSQDLTVDRFIIYDQNPPFDSGIHSEILHRVPPSLGCFAVLIFYSRWMVQTESAWGRVPGARRSYQRSSPAWISR